MHSYNQLPEEAPARQYRDTSGGAGRLMQLMLRQWTAMLLMILLSVSLCMPVAADETDPTPEDGVLTVGECAGMFKIVSASLETIDGARYLRMALNGTGYEVLYKGTPAEAAVSRMDERIYYQENSAGKYEFLLPVSNQDSTFTIAALSKSKNSWYERTIYLDQWEKTIGSETVAVDPIPDDPTPEDGELTIGECIGMFKIVSASLETIEGTRYLRMALSGTGYDYLYKGTPADAAVSYLNDRIHYQENSAGKYEFLLPVSNQDSTFTIAALSKNKNSWYERTIYLDQWEKTIGSETISSDPVPDDPTPEDGELTVGECIGMFKIVSASLETIEGTRYLRMALNGTGYEVLYKGTPAEAAVSMLNERIYYQENSAGKYEFLLPVSNQDSTFTIAALSKSKNSWYERTIYLDQWEKTIYSETVDVDPIPDTPTYPVETLETTVTGTSGMYTPIKAVVTRNPDGTYIARITMKNAVPQYACLGTKEEGLAHGVGWYLNEGTAENSVFTVPISALGVEVPMAFSKDSNKWTNSVLTFSAETSETEEIPAVLDDTKYVPAASADIILPAELTEIETEAFAEDLSIEIVQAGNNLNKISGGAFLNCSNLRRIELPASVSEIADDAFEGCSLLVIYCESGSYAAAYAESHSIPYVIR